MSFEIEEEVFIARFSLLRESQITVERYFVLDKKDGFTDFGISLKQFSFSIRDDEANPHIKRTPEEAVDDLFTQEIRMAKAGIESLKVKLFQRTQDLNRLQQADRTKFKLVIYAKDYESCIE